VEINKTSSDRIKCVIGIVIAACLFLFTSNAYAISIAPTLDSAKLKNALIGSGLTSIDLTSALVTVAGHECSECGWDQFSNRVAATSAGTFLDDSNTFGLSTGIIISSGGVEPNVRDAGYTPYGSTGDGNPATSAQNSLLSPITGKSDHFDVTQIDIAFDMQPGINQIAFDIIFATNERWEGGLHDFNTDFVDGFGLYVNGVNVAFVDHQLVNINFPDFIFGGETQFEGLLFNDLTGVVHHVTAPVNALGNNVTLILGDASDGEVQSGVFVSMVSAKAVPVPTSLILLVSGLVGLIGFRSKFKR